MYSSQSVGKLMSALIEVSKGVNPLTKDKDNPFFKSKYVDHEQAWGMVHELLFNNGLVVVQGAEGITEKSDNKLILVMQTRVIHESGEWIETNCPLVLNKLDPQGVGSAWTYGRRYGLEGILNLARQDADDDGNSASESPKQAKKAPSSPPRSPKPNKPTPTPPSAPKTPAKKDKKYVSKREGAISTVGKGGTGRGQLGLLHVMIEKSDKSREDTKAFVLENYEFPANHPIEHLEDLNQSELNEVLEWLEK